MKTKSVTNSDSIPKLDDKWLLNTYRFWANNETSGLIRDTFVKWCIKNGETTMEHDKTHSKASDNPSIFDGC